jgi:hypothetical protein
MKALVFYVIALSGLACVRAELSPVETKDSSAPKPDAFACLAPKCTAQPTGGAPCDPVCQTGTTCDWCSEKCSIAGDGTVACLSIGTRETESLCTRSSPDSPLQHDDCVAGDVCLPIVGSQGDYCFRHCGSNLDCPGGVRCAERPLTTTGRTAMVCDPHYTGCDPSAPGGGCCDPTTGSGCTDGRFCYLVAKDPVTQESRTVCEYTTGINTRSECSLASDCADGYSCHPSLRACRQVCDLSHPACLVGTCTPNGNQYGFCL